MIIRFLPDDRLLCVNQSSHALMATTFCRYWGNAEFARPTPYDPVMLGIAQHDCGWYEWDQQPELRPDGVPMDFMHGPVAHIKRELWQRSIDRVFAQHPYAALLVGRHADLLYENDLPNLSSDAERDATRLFIVAQDQLVSQVRAALSTEADLQDALCDEAVRSNTQLLKFGDTASLQVTIPWGNCRVFDNCPVDGRGEYTPIVMTFEDDHITFEPWPFGVESFSVSIHGKLLNQTTFDNVTAYRSALQAAPYHHLTWRVAR